LHVVQTSYTWRSDSTITFKGFANGIKVSSNDAATEVIQNLFTMCFAEWKLLLESLMETTFMYRVMLACIEFKLKTTDKLDDNSKPIFYLLVRQPKLSQSSPAFVRATSSTDRGKHWKPLKRSSKLKRKLPCETEIVFFLCSVRGGREPLLAAVRFLMVHARTTSVCPMWRALCFETSYPAKQRFLFLSARWEARGNLCSQPFDFLLCMRELRQHTTCVVLCHKKRLHVIKSLQLCIFDESCTWIATFPPFMC